MSGRDSTIRIGLLLPDVLGTYGDSGNALVLRERLRRRGYAAEIVATGFDEPVPETLDVYTIGGGEDSAQRLALRHMSKHPGLQTAAAAGAPVLAICAGMQILGDQLALPDGGPGGTTASIPGLGLLDITTDAPGAEGPGAGRIIGEVVAQPTGLPRGTGLTEPAGLTDPISGFANHAGRTALGPDAAPLGTITTGTGNRPGADDEGAVQGSIVATYLHGPVLARNPQLADLIIARALGVRLDGIPPLEMPEVDRLRRERLAAR